MHCQSWSLETKSSQFEAGSTSEMTGTGYIKSLHFCMQKLLLTKKETSLNLRFQASISQISEHENY